MIEVGIVGVDFRKFMANVEIVSIVYGSNVHIQR